MVKRRAAISFSPEIFDMLEEYRIERDLERSEVVEMAVKHFIEHGNNVNSYKKELVQTLVQNAIRKVIKSDAFLKLVDEQLKKDLAESKNDA